ncbi:MAG: DUF507 family protein [Persephonella sp.]|nr:DUF507 family protein [Persephonella sp.]
MKIPARLVERIVSNIIKELTEKHYIETENEDEFKKAVFEIINKAIQEEKEIEEEAEKLVEQHMHLIGV